MRRVFDLLTVGQYALARDLYAADYANHDPSAPDVRDRDSLMELSAAFRKGISDAVGAIEDLIAQGDKVTKRWKYRGAHNGEFMGIPPTGKKIMMTAITIYRLAGGKVAECWWNYDTLGVLQQIGAIPLAAEREG